MKFKKQTFLLFLMPLLCFSQVESLEYRDIIPVKEWLFIKGKHFNAQQITFDEAGFEAVNIPHTFSLEAIENVGYYRGETWYRTRVNLPDSMKDERIFIRFEGAGQEATVFVNGKQVGKHIGGYSAFCYEITNAVSIDKDNLIAVMVTNEPNFKRIPVNDRLFNHYGGIYRPVHIFSTPKLNITPTYFASPGVFVEVKNLTKAQAELTIKTHISDASTATKASLSIKLNDAEGQNVASIVDEINLEENELVNISNITIPKPELWQGRKNPYLYSIEVELTSAETTDKVVQEFGLRSFKIDPNEGFFLNGKSYPLYGVNMHEDRKDSGPALNQNMHIEDMNLVEEIGATTLRTSHYQHSELTYKLADEKGILVWAEIPFVNDYSGREGENAKQQLRELILQNYNHPSIFTWGIWNEVRAHKNPDEACVPITKDLVELAHALDPSRPTISASDKGMTSNMGNITDLQAWNKYFGWYYGEYEDMGTWLDKSHAEFPNRPLSISEYGIGGNIYQQDRQKLEKPVGDYFPETEQSYFHETTWQILKDRPYVWSTYIWCMFDFSVNVWNRGGIPHLNHKGLVTYDRKTKKDAFYFYKANWSDEPALYIAERRNNLRTKAETEVKVYTNIEEELELFLNDKKVNQQTLASDISVLRFKSIQLKKGENTIRVQTKDKTFKDQVQWILD